MLKTVEITAVTIQQIGYRVNAHRRKRINFNKKFTVFTNEKEAAVCGFLGKVSS